MIFLRERVFANALFGPQDVNSSLLHLPCTQLIYRAMTVPNKPTFLKDVARFACFASLESL